MARPSKLTKEQWEQVRQAAIGGVSIEQIAGEFGIPSNTIRQAAFKGKWPVPARIKKLTSQEMAKRRKQEGMVTKSNETPSATVLMADSLLQNGERGSLLMSQLALALLERASPESLKPLSHIGDVLTAGKAVRLSAGMDKPQTEVKVNLAMFGSQPSQGTGWEAVDVET